MASLFRTILKDKSSLVLRTPTNDDQIVLASASMPTSEAAFKKYFKVSTTRIECKNQSQVCIGCHVLSNRSLGNIKFRSKDANLLAWLKKERVFLESDNLGIHRPATIGYFTKIAGTYTHLANYRDHLINQLLLVEIEDATVLELAPHLKQAQLDAMSSGDDFDSLPPFEIYRTRLSHGREPSQVSTEVLGVKCAPQDAKLLSEYFMRLASETKNDQRDGVFIPKGAAYLLGTQTYEQILRDNNFFLTTVATVPVNLTYDAWFAVIDANQTDDKEPISLYDHLVRKPWFLRIESAAKDKCLLITTKPNLPEARAWIDANLESLVRKSIPAGIDPPPALLPHRLDKPTFSQSSQTYADILKKQFSLSSAPTPADAANNRPPRKRQAAIIDYDSDTGSGSPAITAASTTTDTHSQPNTSTGVTNLDYAAELQLIKTELATLRTLITTAVEQMQRATESMQTSSHSSAQAMEIEVDKSPAANRSTRLSSELHDLVADLKYEIATIMMESCALVAKSQISMRPNHPPPPPAK